nr:GNAT family N-acetyltransferase [Microlunatus panaciterrae]
MTLRPVSPDDLDLFFDHQQDPAAVWMAAFTPADLPSRVAFDARQARILAEPSIVVRTIEVDGVAVGHVLKYELDGDPEVSYWIGREHWGRGIGTTALARFLAVEITERPVFARVAQDNVGSLEVLRRNGFVIVAEGSGPAEGRGRMVKEYRLELSADTVGPAELPG